MQRNVIVAMATGSGKTNIACLRIEAELQRSSGKRVWFTAPNTVLAEQQHYFLASQLPEYQTRTLLGHDNVDRWESLAVWNAALADMDIVVSTPQVLLDALRNGFVHLKDISLLVVDEAHHCQRKNPSALIMLEHYHPLKRRDASTVPHILGLTASIRISDKTASIDTLESNMDAICRTPTLLSEEYASYVHVPKILEVVYTKTGQPRSDLLVTLCKTVDSIALVDDPYYEMLKRANDPVSVRKLEKIERDQKTPALRELRALYNNAEELHLSVGSWGSDQFIRSCVTNWHQSAHRNNRFEESSIDQKMIFIDSCLSPVREAMQTETFISQSQISAKALELIGLLANEYQKGIAVIIFVERRSTAFALSRLLASVPALSSYRVFSFVGLATSRAGSLIDVADSREQKKLFADFRKGSQDICIATSVAEEGVDIQAVSLVIRYDDPKQLVSFLQSRGRARRHKSKYVHFRHARDSKVKYQEWADLEKEMEEEYKRERELYEHAQGANSLDSQCEEVYNVESTNAKLSYGNSVQHLQHYCNVVSGGFDPVYILTGTVGVSVSATVILPSQVPAQFQEASTKFTWYGEKAAKRDAAFQAYKALHTAGLVTDHLVPFQPERQNKDQAKHGTRICTIPGETKVWQLHSQGYFGYCVEVASADERYTNLMMALPVSLKTALSFQCSVGPHRTLNVKVIPSGQILVPDLQKAKSTTRRLFELSFHVGSASESVEDASRVPLLLFPETDVNEPINFEQTNLLQWLEGRCETLGSQPLFLWKAKSKKPYMWNPQPGLDKQMQPSHEIVINKLKRLQIYTAVRSGGVADTPVTAQTTVKVSECYVRPAATRYGPTVILIPTILHMMAAGLRAQRAQETVFRSIGLDDAEYLTQALISKSACGLYNYERLEFLGDAQLKFRASLQMFLCHSSATEGVLDKKVGEIISNLRFERSVQELGIEPYITTETPSQKHWKLPQIVGDRDDLPERKVTSKTLADVVESTVAAAYLDGAKFHEADVRCTRTLKMFIPEVDWLNPSQTVSAILSNIDLQGYGGRRVEKVRQMTGYTFSSSTLLREAFTHSAAKPGRQSLDRLEFLGDAIIDWIIKARLFHDYTLNADRMTLIRHAVASHVLFAYCALNLECVGHRNCIQISERNSVGIKQLEEISFVTDLIDFHDLQLRIPIGTARANLNEVELQIKSCLNSANFPWTLLRRVNAPKVCSDIIESIIAAVYIDSDGSLEECEKILDRFGIFRILDEMASNEDFEVRTPATRLRELCAERQMTIDICSATNREANSHLWKVIVRRGGDDGEVIEYLGRQATCKDEARSIAAEVALEALTSSTNQLFVGPDQKAFSLTQDSVMTGANDLEDDQDSNTENGFNAYE